MGKANRKYLPSILFAALAICLQASIAAQQTDLKYSPLSIPTRDGKLLAADLHSLEATPQRTPVILIQSPYNKNHYRTGTIPGPGGGKSFPQDGHYNYVIVDWRGFYGSKGADVPGYDRGLDGYDCVEWIASQPWCDGKVGTWGSSALGYIQFLIVLSVRDAAGGELSVTKSLIVSQAPAVTGVAALSNPSRLRVSGSGFKEGCSVEIGGQRAPESRWKSAGPVLAKGSALKAIVPKGTPVEVVVVNPDGARSSPFPFTR